MNMKQILALSIAIMMAMSISLGTIKTANAQATVLSLQPGTISGPPPDLGETFTVTLEIADVTNLWGWAVNLAWGPTVLEMVGAPTEGTFLQPGTLFAAAPPDNVNGILPDMSCGRTTATGVSGSGVLASMTFRVKGYGSTTINITYSELLDPAIPHNQILHTIANSNFNLPPPPAHGPTAKFTPADGTWYMEGDSIFLDATSSTPGYDTVPVAEVCPITSYDWQIDFGNDGSVEMIFGGVTATILASIVGDVKVTLTVTAPDPTPPSGSGYSTTDTEIHILHIRAIPQGADIDIYTQRGGVGPDAQSDAFGPQELVILYAKVTYNNVPVANKDVAFEIQNADGTAIAYRTGRANSEGIATAEYRLPWPDEDPEAGFGIWTIIGTVDVSQVVVNDTCTFQFDYIIKIVSVQTLLQNNTPATSFARESSVKVNVTLSNIRKVDVATTVTITIYDEAKVPIAAFVVEISVTAQGQTWTAGTMTIPSWAFVGQATVYVNALTQLPSLSGVPCCPESAINFQITA